METFDATREPMRAIRDLIAQCELTALFIDDFEVLERAQVAFTALRKLFGDERPAEEIADAAMIEPRDLRTALQMTTGALQTVTHGEDRDNRISFTGRWRHLGTFSISAILDRADEALETA
jgi:hypothetical protein